MEHAGHIWRWLNREHAGIGEGLGKFAGAGADIGNAVGSGDELSNLGRVMGADILIGMCTVVEGARCLGALGIGAEGRLLLRRGISVAGEVLGVGVASRHRLSNLPGIRMACYGNTSRTIRSAVVAEDCLLPAWDDHSRCRVHGYLFCAQWHNAGHRGLCHR